MVLGRGKEKQIQDEPLLSWYFDLFRRVINRMGRKILIIGYGFRDEHINEVIAKAVDQFRLKIYVISPESQKNFHNSLRNERIHGDTILKGLEGYHQTTLTDMFYGENDPSHYYDDLRSQFFESPPLR
ncbi:MAG: SIR2 family protein [Candidatus Aminicenantaceae bacterium]